MEKKRSLAAYRTIDLMLWAAILVLFEGVILRASRSVFFVDQPFTVSLAGAVACIVYMRWGFWGGIHAFLAGAVNFLRHGHPAGPQDEDFTSDLVDQAMSAETEKMIQELTEEPLLDPDSEKKEGP